VEADSGNGYTPGWGMLLMMMTHYSTWISTADTVEIHFDWIVCLIV